jgi:hypothetical protein
MWGSRWNYVYVAGNWSFIYQMKRSDFSMKGTHGFLGLFKYKKELHTRREERTSKYPELDGSGSGLRFNSKCVGVGKNGDVANMFAS